MIIIYISHLQAVSQMVEPMFEDKNRPVDFIVVGPFEEDSKRVTGQCNLTNSSPE